MPGLDSEKQRIFDKSEGATIEYSMTVIANDEQYKSLVIEEVVTKRAYLESYGDYVYVRATFSVSDYRNIWTYRANLEAILTYKINSVKHQQKLKAVLNSGKGSKDNADLRDTTESKNRMAVIEFQLINPAVYNLRAVNIEPFVIKDGTVSDAISSSFNDIKDDVKTRGELKLVMAKADNQRKYPSMIIPSGRTIFNIAKILQEGEFGIYNGSVATYLQRAGTNDVIYIFPPYRLDSTTKKLKVVSLSSDEAKVLTKSYVDSSSLLEIIVGDDNAINDRMHESAMDHGNAIEVVDSDTIAKRAHEVKDGKVNIKPSNVRTTMVHEKKKDGVVKPSEVVLTNNYYHPQSKVLSRQGMVVTVTWFNSNPDLIFPGMSVTYVYENLSGEVDKLTGTVIGTFSVYSGSSKNSITKIVMFIRNYEQW